MLQAHVAYGTLQQALTTSL